jgi:hypothetical protein
MLELKLSDKPEWKLFVKPSPELSANSKLRRLLGRPIGRSTGVATSAKNEFGWTWWIPSTCEGKLSISGQGKQPSWRAKPGLPEYAHETVHNILDIRVYDSSALHSTLCGQYELLTEYGTLYSSLYKRIVDKPSIIGQDMFFFMDPDPIGVRNDDQYVFSDNHERQQDVTQTREVFAVVDASWRAWEKIENTRVYEPGL